MTDKQKARAYDEAVERAKLLHLQAVAGNNPIMVERYERIFPQLRESEDERIRKFLIQHISEWIGCIEHDLKISSKDIESEKDLAMFKAGLAWLEKQKEQKPAEWSGPKEFISDTISMRLKSLHAQPQQEWSEDIIRKAVKEVGLTQHQIDWFKTNVFPPKQGWSKEDENMLNSCISSIEEAKENRYYYRETDGDTSYDHEISWLKSLRPQSHWKPTDEQMEALGYAITGDFDKIPPTSYLSRRLEEIEEFLKTLI